MTHGTCEDCGYPFRARLLGGRVKLVEWDRLSPYTINSNKRPGKWFLDSIERSKSDPEYFVEHKCTATITV